jgi:hypothetical protein
MCVFVPGVCDHRFESCNVMLLNPIVRGANNDHTVISASWDFLVQQRSHRQNPYCAKRVHISLEI